MSALRCTIWRCRFGQVDAVMIGDGQRADAGGGQVHWPRANPTAQADDQRAGYTQLS